MTAGSGVIHDEEPSDELKRLGGVVEVISTFLTAL